MLTNVWKQRILSEIFSGQTSRTFGSEIKQVNAYFRLEDEEKEIKQIFAKSSDTFRQIRQYVDNFEVSWSFHLPYGPHFGGLWEVAVKSYKHHYRRVIGDQALTFEEHSTLATHNESCLNSRPLCSISVDKRDCIPLRPGHFLVSRPLQTLPPASTTSVITKTYSDRWILIMNNMRNSF